jgi:hypothetical protein
MLRRIVKDAVFSGLPKPYHIIYIIGPRFLAIYPLDLYIKGLLVSVLLKPHVVGSQ